MEDQTKFHPDPKLHPELHPELNPELNPEFKLMDQVREVLRYHHDAYRTEQSYCNWILRYIRFYGNTIHPRNLEYIDVEKFLCP